MKKSDIRKIIREEIQNSLKEYANSHNDIRFWVDGVSIQIWLTVDELEYDSEITKLKNNTTMPLEQKEKLALERAASIAEDKLKKGLSEQFGDEVRISELNLTAANVDLKFDRIDWESLLTNLPEDEY